MSGRPVAACGTESGYKRHRRNGEDACDECKAARAAYQRGKVARRKLVAMEDPATPHGTFGGYNNHGCRCDRCRAANAAEFARSKAARADRLRMDPTLAPHGVASTYGNWGCRCRPCTEANAVKKREQYGRSRQANL